MEMSERIKERRIAMGMTQEELGEKLGLKKSAIAKYENGRVENMKRSNIRKMAEVLECSPNYLLGYDAEYHASDLKPVESLSSEEIKLVKAFRDAPDDMKDGIRRFLGIEKE